VGIGRGRGWGWDTDDDQGVGDRPGRGEGDGWETLRTEAHGGPTRAAEAWARSARHRGPAFPAAGARPVRHVAAVRPSRCAHGRLSGTDIAQNVTRDKQDLRPLWRYRERIPTLARRAATACDRPAPARGQAAARRRAGGDSRADGTGPRTGGTPAGTHAGALHEAATRR